MGTGSFCRNGRPKSWGINFSVA